MLDTQGIARWRDIILSAMPEPFRKEMETALKARPPATAGFDSALTSPSRETLSEATTETLKNINAQTRAHKVEIKTPIALARKMMAGRTSGTSARRVEMAATTRSSTTMIAVARSAAAGAEMTTGSANRTPSSRARRMGTDAGASRIRTKRNNELRQGTLSVGPETPVGLKKKDILHGYKLTWSTCGD